MSRGFASDNFSSVSKEIINFLKNINLDHQTAYGYDIYTEKAITLLKEKFGDNINPYFVTNGTAANVLSIKSFINSFEAVITTDCSHIDVDECGAFEKFAGSKILTVPNKNGKLTIEAIKPLLLNRGVEHHVQPKMITITQPTELGTVYTLNELNKLKQFAKENDLYIHIDGARLSNAVVALNVDFKDIIKDIDVLSFGGAKNGMMIGEVVIFFNKNNGNNFKFLRKQGMQLISKMRYISGQFIPYLENNLWETNAKHSNKMAKLLYNKVKELKNIEIIYSVETNAVFAKIPKNWIEKLQNKVFFWVWDYENSIVRWMTSFDTKVEDIDNFINLLKSMEWL